MVINIKTDKEKIFKQYIQLINPMLGNNKLAPSEIEILSRLLLVDYMYRHITEQDRNLLIFHTKTRNQILLDISKTIPTFSKAVFNNTLVSLKKKGIISNSDTKGELKLEFHNPLIALHKIKPTANTLTLTINFNGEDLV